MASATRWASSQVVLVVENPPANARDVGDADLIRGLRRSPGGEQSTPLQHSCLQNPKDRGNGYLSKGFTALFHSVLAAGRWESHDDDNAVLWKLQDPEKGMRQRIAFLLSSQGMGWGGGAALPMKSRVSGSPEWPIISPSLLNLFPTLYSISCSKNIWDDGHCFFRSMSISWAVGKVTS